MSYSRDWAGTGKARKIRRRGLLVVLAVIEITSNKLYLFCPAKTGKEQNALSRFHSLPFL